MLMELLAVISLLVSGVVTEPQSGPYPESGWKPSGPAFEIPQPGQAQQQPAEYLPPVDPRNPPNSPHVEYGAPSNSVNMPDVEYGPPEGPNNPNAQGFPEGRGNSDDRGNVGFGVGVSPSIGVGIPQGPGIAANNPNVGFGFGVSPGAGVGIPQGPGIAANNPNVGFGFGVSPGAGVGIPQGPSIAANTPNVGFGVGVSPGVGVGIPQGPGVGLGVSLDTPADVSVQGLPPKKEEAPFFAPSPINGLQNVGFGFNAAIRNLNQNLQQDQYEQQQQNYREFQRQRQLDAYIGANRLIRPGTPSAFVPRTTPAAAEMSTPEETTVATTTEISLNEGETLDAPKKKEKVTVELTAQKIQEYPGELFLSSLAQLQLQPQFTSLQFGQLKDPLYVQPLQSQKQLSGFDAQTHFAVLPSIIAQQKLQQQSLLIPGQPQAVPELQAFRSYQEPQYQVEQVPPQPQAFYPQANFELQYQPQLQMQTQEQPQPQFQLQPLPQYAAQTVQFQQQPAQFTPQPVQFQPQPAQFQPRPGQFQPQPAQFQPQPAQFQPQPAPYQPALLQPQPDNKDAENIDQSSYQPQIYQQQFLVPQSNNQPQPGYVQAQMVNYPSQDFPQFQGQFLQQQNQFQQQNEFASPSQGADALQSGLDINQQGNNIDEPQDQEEGKDEGTTATAVATAFGTRTQPRVIPKYGAPFPVPRVQADPERTTTEAPAEEVTDEGPVVAHAVAIADGTRKKSAKLRRNRLRPIFTLDKSGHLVLAQGQ
ncbi:unnamed protein product [Arctia plantaginis]|uniref:Uncharacterized protein n=1 Tax=Arctia plantaginis TaxID=874455 RepID=A0A8S1BCH0_ARCPL|nr:unnamed protein product [Arctia plantaginis]